VPEASFEFRGAVAAYAEEGEGETAVLFLHAFPLSRRLWQPQLAALSPHHRYLVLDAPGFGGSALAGPVSRMEDLAAQALALLDHRSIERAVVAGLSMGGYAALALVEAAPERLRGLILSDTRAAADTPEGRQGRFDSAALALREGSGALAGTLLPKLLGDTTRRERPEIVDRVAGWIAEAPREGVAAAQRGMAERPDRFAVLHRLAVPALVLVGEEDGLTPPDDSRRLAEALAGSRLEIVPGAGHLSSLEAPDTWNAAVAAFLQTL
jgi:pimeloyl-ACP methyl ester carboxylesterase